MATAPQEITFARVGNKGFMVGINLAAIVADVTGLFPEVPPEEIISVSEQLLPPEYSWSVRRVKEYKDWEKPTGTYLLIKNFETYEDAFKRYFPRERV